MLPALAAVAARLAPMVARAAIPAAKSAAGNGRLAAFTAGRMMSNNNQTAQQPQQPQQPMQGGYNY